MNNNESPSSEIGANLKQLIRESKYRTQEEFAFEFGVDARSVRRWVSNGVDSVNTIYQIARFLEIDINEILP